MVVAWLVELLGLVALLGATAAFIIGAKALGAEHDLTALYWLLVGALLLRASSDMVRPSSGSRT